MSSISAPVATQDPFECKVAGSHFFIPTTWAGSPDGKVWQVVMLTCQHCLIEFRKNQAPQ